MQSGTEELSEHGFFVVARVIPGSEASELAARISHDPRAGSRDLLDAVPVCALVRRFRECPQLEAVLNGLVAVQCTSFLKSQTKNWAVRLHRDRVIPAKNGTGWESSGTKDGMAFVRPPLNVLEGMVAVRLNLDDANEGDLQVVPGSHRSRGQSKRNEAVPVPVGQGGTLVMRPLLEHASTKLRSSPARRVLHFLFGPPDLPHGYHWYHAVR